GKHHPELAAVQQHFGTVSGELTSHMRKEEMVLFPYIKRLEEAADAGRRVPRPPFGTIRNPVRMMELEHEAAGDLLEQISKKSSDYTPPAEACFSYKALYTALKEFAEDLHQHVHLENNILFPRAITLEEKSGIGEANGDEKPTRCSTEAAGSFPKESCCLPQK
ncbi:MAG: hemerythrin domain-containing protein, partial [Candidatus Angelobacter sp.]